MQKKRARIVYSGAVQGVGFRWTAERAGNSNRLTGWVQNCPDGTVEAVCEGKEEDIQAFMRNIKKQMGDYIRSMNIDWQNPTGEFDSFTIKFFGA